MFKLIAFDMDGTLAPSKGQIDVEMSELLVRLLGIYKVAIISGGDFPQFEKQVIPFLGKNRDILKNLYILPTSGAKFYEFKDDIWSKVYSKDFTLDERKYIIDVLNSAIIDLDLIPPKVYGQQIEDRGTQITFSALGQKAPIEIKGAWDPNSEKRIKIRNYIIKDLQSYAIGIGGSSSIDITHKGVDKAYGIKKLVEILDIDLNDIIFVGDAIFVGGNDYPPVDIGTTSKKVFDVDDTKRYIKSLLGL